MPSRSYQTIDERQRYVQRSGEDWENFVMNFLNGEFRRFMVSLKVLKGRKIFKSSAIWKKLAIPVGGGEKIWGDIDLVVVDKRRSPVAVISCKTSLHGRFSETLFYAVALKELVKGLKVVFATPDKGRQQKQKSWQSEWGSDERPTKDRALASHYLDGVYVLNENTHLGGKIKPLSALPGDLKRWYRS